MSVQFKTICDYGWGYHKKKNTDLCYLFYFDKVGEIASCFKLSKLLKKIPMDYKFIISNNKYIANYGKYEIIILEK